MNYELNYEYVYHQDSTIIDLLEEGEAGEALDILKEVLSLAIKSNDIHPCLRAEQISKAFYNLMLFYASVGDIKEAAYAAKEAFEYDQFLFEQYPLILKILLSVDLREMDEVAACLLDFFDSHEGEFHNMSEELEEARNMCAEVAERSDAIKWILAEKDYVNLILRAEEEDDPSAYDEALRLVDSWIAEGADINRCDSFKVYVYYHQGKKDKAIELWEDRSPKDVTSPFTFVWLMLCMIDEGFLLPNPLPLPDLNNVIKWARAGYLAYKSFRHIVLNAGLTEAVLAGIEEAGEDEKVKFFERVKLARAVTAHSIALYERFFEGEKNGTATSPFQYVDCLDTQGELLGKTGDPAGGMAELEKGMRLFPHKVLARSIVDLALDMKDGKRALGAIQWLKNHIQWQKENTDDYEESWVEVHAIDRLEVWAHALTCETFAEYLPYEEAYEEKYKEICTYFKHFSLPMAGYIPPVLKEESDEFFYGLNNRRQCLMYFLEREPENPVVISRIFHSYSKVPSLASDEWIRSSLHLLDTLREKVDRDSDEGRRLLCAGLAGAGYLLSVSAVDFDENDDMSLMNEEVWQQGLDLIDEASEYVEDRDQKLDLLLKRISLYRMVEDCETIRELSKSGLELIKDYHPSQYSEEDCERRWRIFAQPIKDKVSFLFIFFHYCIAKASETLGDVEPKELIELQRNVYRVFPEHSLLWYKLSDLLLPFALENPDSPEFDECVYFTRNYLTLFADEPENSMRGFLLINLGKLMLAKGGLRSARFVSDLMDVDYSDSPEHSEELDDFMVSIEEAQKDFEEGRGVFAPKEENLLPAFVEAEERKERTVAKMREMGIEPLALPFVETSGVVRHRSAEEIVHRAVCAAKLSKLARMILIDWDVDLYGDAMSELKTLGLLKYLTVPEAELVERYAVVDEISSIFQLGEALMSLFWVLGDLDEFPSATLSLDELDKLADKHIVDNKVVFFREPREINEILDALDFSFRMTNTLFYNLVQELDTLSIEECRELTASANFYRMQTFALSWVVDADGTNCWNLDLSSPYHHSRFVGGLSFKLRFDYDEDDE